MYKSKSLHTYMELEAENYYDVQENAYHLLEEELEHVDPQVIKGGKGINDEYIQYLTSEFRSHIPRGDM